MIVKQFKNQIRKQSSFCGQFREILTATDYPHFEIVVFQDIKCTDAHYHGDFEEIYFVLDGAILIKLYDPDTEKEWIQQLNENELCVISKGINHKIIDHSANNRLCVISVPRYDTEDTFKSDKIK
jgi:mannose-6-phosphate isomerase-like protein (cupin superfamily)